MTLSEKEIANILIECFGGKENIVFVYNCYTRVRANVKKIDLVDEEKIKSISGVIGTVIGGSQVQVIVGPGKSTKLAQAITKIIENNENIGSSSNSKQTTQDANASSSSEAITKQSNSYLDNKVGFRGKLNGGLNRTLKKIAGIFVPIIPAFIACGLLLALNEVLKNTITGFEKQTVGIILKIVSESVFTILNVIVGYNATKEFGGDGIIGAILAGVLGNELLNGITVGPFVFKSGYGGVISVILVAIAAAYFEKLLRKFMPNIVDAFLTPLITISVMSIAGLFIFQPLGGKISDGIAIGVKAIVNHVPYLLGLIPMVYLPLVLIGMHHGLIAVSSELIIASETPTTRGITPIVPVQLMAGAAEVGAAIFVILVTRNKKLKKTVIGALPIGVLGIDEPLIWGMSFPNKRLFFASSAGGLVAGSILATLKVGAFVPEATGIEAALTCDKPWWFAMCFGIAIVLGFIFAALIGYKDTITYVDPDTNETKEEIRETSLVIKAINKWNKNHPKKA